MNKTVFRQKLLKMVIPLTFQYFLFSLVPVADAAMLVKLEQDAMSAVSLATQISFVLNLFIFAITTGANMLAAQYWGRGDSKAVEQVWGFSQLLLLPVGLIFWVATFFFPEAVMRIYTSESSLIGFGAQYLRIVSFSYLMLCIIEVMQTIMKNVGLVPQVTASNTFMVICNIILNAVFIYGLFGAPAMGVRGAALATLISTGGNFIISLTMQLLRSPVHFRFRYLFRIASHLRQDFIRYAGPVLANQITWGFGFTTLTVIMGHLGSDAVAANAIVAIVKDIVSCLCFALSSTSTIIVGNELGADRMDTAREYASHFCRLSLFSGFGAGIIILLSTPLVLRFADLTPTASYYLKWMLVMCVYYMVGRFMNSIVIAGIFCAGGDTKFGFVCDTITMWAFIIPVGAFVAFVLHAPVLVVYFLLNLDELVKLPAVYKHYKKYKWLKNLTVQEKA